MALPTFVQAGTGYGSATLATTHSVARPAGVAAGNLLIAVIEATNTDGNAAAIGQTPSIGRSSPAVRSPAPTTASSSTGRSAETTVDTAGGSISVVGTGGATADGIFARIFEFSSSGGWATPPVQRHRDGAHRYHDDRADRHARRSRPRSKTACAVMAMVLNDDAGDIR